MTLLTGGLRRWVLSSLAVLALALALIGVVGAGTTPRSFADGRWSGTSPLAEKLDGFTLTGKSTFSFQVKHRRVTSGSLKVKGAAHGVYEGKVVNLTISGRIPLKGPATAVSGRGKMTVTVHMGGTSKTRKPGFIYTFMGLRGTCKHMTGKILRRLTAKAAAGLSTVSPFVATRTASSGPRC